jgi:ribosomal protein S21
LIRVDFLSLFSNLKATKLPKIKKLQDNPVVAVIDGDIGFALKILQRRIEASAIFKTRKLRARFPNPNDRARWKRKQSLKRCKRYEKIKQLYEKE